MLEKYFLAKLFVSCHLEKCFSTILGNSCKIEFLTEIDRRGPYKNSENLVPSQKVLENIFWQNYLFLSSRELFLHNFRQFFGKLNFDRNKTGAALTKIVKI